ncbi:MAG: helix-turn-helix transcriptional regulator [Candidatus Omnitrophota bacterium]
MNLVKALDSYRLEHKISQQDIASRLGVSFVTVNRWLNGKTKPNKIQQYHIKKLLKDKWSQKLASHGSSGKRR